MISGHEKNLFVLRYPGVAQIIAYEEKKDKAEEIKLLDLIKELEPLKEQQEYKFLPFYTIYQTKFNNKEQYSAIAAWGMHYEREEHPYLGNYLMALVDCYGCMSEEIYEHKRAVREAVRTGIQRMLHRHKAKDGWQKDDCIQNYRAAYAIWKACYLHILLPDHYLKAAKKALAAAESMQPCASLTEDEKQEINLILAVMEECDPYAGGWEVQHGC